MTLVSSSYPIVLSFRLKTESLRILVVSASFSRLHTQFCQHYLLNGFLFPELAWLPCGSLKHAHVAPCVGLLGHHFDNYRMQPWEQEQGASNSAPTIPLASRAFASHTLQTVNFLKTAAILIWILSVTSIIVLGLELLTLWMVNTLWAIYTQLAWTFEIGSHHVNPVLSCHPWKHSLPSMRQSLIGLEITNQAAWPET